MNLPRVNLKEVISRRPTSQMIEKERALRKKSIEKWLQDIGGKLKNKHKASNKTVKNIKRICRIVPQRSFSPKNRVAMFCAAIIVGSRLAKEPVTLKEAQEVVELKGYHSVNVINRHVRQLYKKLKEKIVPPDPTEYIDRFCLKIGLSKEIAEKAKKKIKGEGTDGLSPPGIAIAAISLAANEFGQNFSINELEKNSGLTAATIRKIVRRISEKHQLLFF